MVQFSAFICGHQEERSIWYELSGGLYRLRWTTHGQLRDNILWMIKFSSHLLTVAPHILYTRKNLRMKSQVLTLCAACLLCPMPKTTRRLSYLLSTNGTSLARQIRIAVWIPHIYKKELRNWEHGRELSLWKVASPLSLGNTIWVVTWLCVSWAAASFAQINVY